MNVQLSRRVGPLMNVPPLVELGPWGVYEFAAAVGKAASFEDLPRNYQESIREAEANLARLVAEKQARSAVAAG
jgi:hypothetical protein